MVMRPSFGSNENNKFIEGNLWRDKLKTIKSLEENIQRVLADIQSH